MKLLVIGSGGREHALVWKLVAAEKADAILKFIHGQKQKAWIIGEDVRGKGEVRLV